MAFKVDYFTLAALDATNKYVVLSGVPVDTSSVALDVISGTAQLMSDSSGDFAVTDSTVRWDSSSYGLNSQLITGDKLRVIYDRS